MDSAHLLDSIDDAEAYAVYADALQSRGHPQGELIAIHQASEVVGLGIESNRRGRLDAGSADLAGELDALRARERALLHEHAEVLLGPLTHYVDLVDLEWRWGFVHRATLWFGDVEPSRVLGAFLESPVCELVQDLSLSAPALLTDYHALMEQMAEKGRPRGLRSLFLGKVRSFEAARLQPPPMIGRVRTLNDVCAHLERVVLHGNQIDVTGLELPELRTLEVRSLQPELFENTFNATWPRLERLVVSFPFTPPEQMQPLFAAAAMPELRHLRVGHPRSWCHQPAVSPQWCEAFVRSPLLRQLETLELEGELVDAAVETLAAHHEKLAHLKRLDVGRNGLSFYGWACFRDLIHHMVSSGDDNE